MPTSSTLALIAHPVAETTADSGSQRRPWIVFGERHVLDQYCLLLLDTLEVSAKRAKLGFKRRENPIRELAVRFDPARKSISFGIGRIALGAQPAIVLGEIAQIGQNRGKSRLVDRDGSIDFRSERLRRVVSISHRNEKHCAEMTALQVCRSGSGWQGRRRMRA